jgi:hypothetical protein
MIVLVLYSIEYNGSLVIYIVMTVLVLYSIEYSDSLGMYIIFNRRVILFDYFTKNIRQSHFIITIENQEFL